MASWSCGCSSTAPGSTSSCPLLPPLAWSWPEKGKTGRRLGQLNAIRNLAAILGSALVFVGFRYLGMTFQLTFTLAAVGFVIAAVLLFSMKPGRPQPSGDILKLHKEYRLYYVLAVLYGSRKQLFITFAPWVLVTIFNQPTQTLATLLTIGGIIGISSNRSWGGRSTALASDWC